MFCSNCGAEVNGTYCSSCGAKIKDVNSMPQPPRSEARRKQSVLLRSKNCSSLVGESEEKTIRGLDSGLLIGSLAIGAALLWPYIFAILNDEDLDRVKSLPLGVQFLLLAGLGVLMFVVLRERSRAKEIHTRYRGYCATEVLTIEEQKIYGSTMQGSFELPVTQIKKVSHTAHLGLSQKNPADPFCDILRIQEVSGKTHTFYSFTNGNELKSTIERQMRDAPPAPASTDSPAQTVSAAPRKQNNTTPVVPQLAGDDIICPVCGTRQRGDRKVCWSCAQKFTD